MKTRLVLLAALVPIISSFVVAAEPDQDFVAHEWGTFTSVQGTDGLQMDWNPFVAPDLPKFVYDRVRPRAGKPVPIIRGLTKAGMGSVQRMETPVIYFYSDKARTIDVEVKFPQGQVTEWYPQDTVADSNMAAIGLPAMKSSRPALLWKGLEVLPKADSAKIELPVDPSGSHYFAARATDAAMVRAPVGDKKEVEKFLFYRGVANFQAPLTVKPDANDPKRLNLTNTGAEELRHLFVYEVRDDGKGAWLSIDKLAPRETRTVSLEAVPGVHPFTPSDLSLDKAAGPEPVQGPRLNASLCRALIHEGLYPLEASAMVKTWESSWFGEKGLRILYTLPREWTDRTLPLTITPAPHAIQRVMVARAEVITTDMEQKLTSLVGRYTNANQEAREQIVAETRALGLGRFLSPAIIRVMVASPRSPQFVGSASQLMGLAGRQVSGPAKATAAK